MAAKDFYKILNLKKSASKEEIKKSYRTLARKFHPDLNPNGKTAEEKFKEVSEAYETLIDDEKRKIYDAGGFDPSQRPSPGGTSYYHQTQSQDDSRYRDIFREAFGGGINFEDLFSQQERGRQSRPLKGEDQLFRLEVPFKDSILGSEQTVVLPTGEKIAVTIPAGVKSGQKLKLTGRGGPGFNKGPNGDLFIEILVKDSTQFKRLGNDIEVEVPVLFSVALLGGSVRVPTPDGQVELTLPAGVSSGTKMRVKGKGVRKSPPGDLYAALKITVPKKIPTDLKKAVEDWHKTYGEKLGEEASK